MPALDPRDVRPLSRHEIGKVLFAIIGGVVAADPRLTKRIPSVLELVRVPATEAHPISVYDAECRAYVKIMGGDGQVSWEVALLATVVGFRAWCDPDDVAAAIEWVDQHLDILYTTLGVSPPS